MQTKGFVRTFFIFHSCEIYKTCKKNRSFSLHLYMLIIGLLTAAPEQRIDGIKPKPKHKIEPPKSKPGKMS